MTPRKTSLPVISNKAWGERIPEAAKKNKQRKNQQNVNESEKEWEDKKKKKLMKAFLSSRSF